MTIVAPGTSFTVKFIPKDEIAELGAFIIYNKQTGVSTTLSPGNKLAYYDNEYYVEADCTYTITEGEFLKYTIYTSQVELSYVGSIFVTSQSDYSINNDKYTENITGNAYITR